MRLGLNFSISRLWSAISALTPPTILSLSSFSVAENSTFNLPLLADIEGGVWSIQPGLDAAEFSLVDELLTFSAQDFDTDVSVGTNNIYQCVVRYTLGAQYVETTISATVLNEQVEILLSPATSLTTQSTYPTSNSTSPEVTVTIPLGVNGVLLAFVHKATNCTWTATAGGDNMTLLTSAVQDEGGSNFNSMAIFGMENPPAGSMTVIGTPSDLGGVTGRRGITVLFMESARWSDIVVGTPYENEAGLTQYSAANQITTDEPDMTVFGLICGATTISAFTWIDYPDNTTGFDPVATSGSTSCYGVFYREVNTPGAQSFNNFGFLTSATSGGTREADPGRRINMVSVAVKGLVHQEQLPIYYFSSAGNDSNDGFSEGAPKKSIEALEALMPLGSGARIKLKSGEYIRRTTPISGTTTPLLNLTHEGTSLAPVVFETYGGSEPGWLSGDILYPTGWVATTSAETNPTANSLGAETRSMGTTAADKPKAWFPCIDGEMLEPCQWSASPLADANGHASAIDAWDDSYDGTDSFHFPPAGDIQSGNSYNAAKKVRWSVGGIGYIIEIEHPDIAAHYGADPMVGALCAWRHAGNQTVWSRITAYNQGTSTITFEGTYAPHSSFFWAIIQHPKDLVKVGQYCWSLDDTKVHALWPAGSVKSIAQGAIGIQVSSAHSTFNNIGICRTAAETGNTTDGMFEVNAGVSYGTTTDLHFKQALNPERTSCIASPSSGAETTNWTFTDTKFEHCRHHSGFRLGKVKGWLIDGVYARRLGRTIIAMNGSTNDTIARNIDCCDHYAIHGNVVSEYQGSYNNTTDKVGALNIASGITAQMKGADVVPAAKGSTRQNIIISMARPVSTTPGVAYTSSTSAVRIDGSDTDVSWDRILIPLYSTIGMSMNTEADSPSPTKDNAGSSIQRSFLGAMSSSDDNPWYGLRDCDIDAVLVNAQPFMSSLATWTSHVTQGGASGSVTNSEFDAAQTWAGGAMSDKMWEYMTRNDARSGYEAIQLGPDSWNWQIPAYGGTRTMVSLDLTTKTFKPNRQIGKTLGAIIKAMPGSTLSLPAGQGDNDAYFAIDRGVVIVTALMPAGTHDLVVRETNASASNGPTRDTTIQIVVAG